MLYLGYASKGNHRGALRFLLPTLQFVVGISAKACGSFFAGFSCAITLRLAFSRPFARDKFLVWTPSHFQFVSELHSQSLSTVSDLVL